LKHYCFLCEFRDVHLQSYDFCKIKVLKNNILSKNDFQLLKSISSTVDELNSLRLFFENSSLLYIRKWAHFKMIDQEWCYSWIILYELMIKVDKVKKCLNLFHHSWLWSILNDLHSILLHWNFSFFLLYILEKITFSWRICILRAWCRALKSAVCQEFIIHDKHVSREFCWISECHSDKWDKWCQEIWTESDSYKSERKSMHWWDQRALRDTCISQISYKMSFFIHFLLVCKVCWTRSWCQAW